MQNVRRAAGIDVGFFPKEIKPLVKQYGAAPLIAIGKASGENGWHVFHEALPAVKDLIARYGIEPFVAIAQASGEYTGCVFQYGLQVGRKRIRTSADLKDYGRALATIAQLTRAGWQHEDVLREGISAANSLIEEYGIEPFVAIAQADPVNAKAVFQYGLPQIKDQIKAADDLRTYGVALGAIAQACGGSSGGYGEQVLQRGIPAVHDLIAKYGIQPVVEIAQATGNRYVIENGLPAVSNLIEQYGIEPFVEIARLSQDKQPGRSGVETLGILRDGLPIFRDQIKDLQDLQTYSQALRAISRSTQFRSGEVLREGLPAVKNLVKDYGIEPIPPIVEASGRHAKEVLQYGLPALRDTIKSLEDLQMSGEALALMTKATAFSSEEVFKDALPATKDMVSAYGIKSFIPISEASLGNTRYVIQYGLPLVRQQIRNLADFQDYSQALTTIAQNTGWNVSGVFTTGLPANKDFIDEYGIEPFVELAQKNGPNTLYLLLLNDEIPALNDLIKTESDLRAYGELLTAIAHKSDNDTNYIFSKGLPLVRERIHSFNDVEAYGDVFLSIAKASGHYAGEVFIHGLPAVADEICSDGFSRPDLLVNKLESVLASLPEPHDEITGYGPYGEEIIETVDPEAGRRNGYTTLIKALRTDHVPSAHASSDFKSESERPSRVPTIVNNFLRFLNQHGLSDVVLIGGAPRDVMLGREPNDLDITLSLDLRTGDLALLSLGSTDWNEELGGRLVDRIEATARALGATVEGFLRGESRFQGRPVHYAGPYILKVKIDGVERVRQARFGMVVSRPDGRVVGLGPMISIESVGLDATGRWVGDMAAAKSDIEARLIKPLQLIRRLDVDHVPRYLAMKLALGFTLSRDLAEVMREFAEEVQKHPQEFLRQAHNYSATFQENLLNLMSTTTAAKTVAELDALGLTNLFRQTQGDGATALNNALSHGA